MAALRLSHTRCNPTTRIIRTVKIAFNHLFESALSFIYHLPWNKKSCVVHENFYRSIKRIYKVSESLHFFFFRHVANEMTHVGSVELSFLSRTSNDVESLRSKFLQDSPANSFASASYNYKLRHT